MGDSVPVLKVERASSLKSRVYPDQSGLDLITSLQFDEPHSSLALNRNIHGLVPHGIYQGFGVSLAGGMSVLIGGSVPGAALAKHANVSLTIHQQGGKTVALVAGEKQYIIIDSFFQYGVKTKQVDASASQHAAEYKVVRKSELLPHHVVIACFDVPAGVSQLVDSMIVQSERSIGGWGIKDHTSQFDPHPQYAHQSVIDEKMMSDAVAFCRSESQQTQQAKQHMALSKQVDDLKPADAADIDAKASGLIKYVNLSMLWRALDANLREAKLHATLKHNRAISYAGTKYEQVTTALSHASAEIKAYADSKAAQASSTAKSYTDTKHGAAIHHTNTEKGNVITLLKSFVLQKLGEHQSAIDEKMMSDAVAFCRSESQQAQQAKQHMALSKQVDDLKPADAADIDAKASGLIKYVNLSMLWRALDANLREAKLHATLKHNRAISYAGTKYEQVTTALSHASAEIKAYADSKAAQASSTAKSYTDTKHGAAIHHTNTEKGNVITLLKSFVLQKLGEHQSAIDEKMMSDAVAFCRSESQQAQQAKQHMALSKKVADLKPVSAADIDAKASGLIKYVNLSMLWRALAANLREAKLHTTLNCKRVMIAAKNHTNAKYSAAIHHTNTEKGKTITELKSFISSNYLSKSSSGATKSFGHNGYIKLPSFLGGLIIQYGGAYTKPGSGMRTTLPIRYPNSHLVCVGTFDNGTGHDGVTPMLLSKDLGGVTFGHHFTRQPRHVAFISIGY